MPARGGGVWFCPPTDSKARVTRVGEGTNYERSFDERTKMVHFICLFSNGSGSSRFVDIGQSMDGKQVKYALSLDMLWFWC